LGQKLAKPATICLIGSSPGIVSGQPDRQSADIDIWRQSSVYDETELLVDLVVASENKPK